MASANNVPDYLLRILLREATPVVTRTLLVPSNTMFRDLHYAIAAAFGWKVRGEIEQQIWKFFVLEEVLSPTAPRQKVRRLLQLFEGASSDSGVLVDTYGMNIHSLLSLPELQGMHLLYSATGRGDLHLLKVIGRPVARDNGLIKCVEWRGRIPTTMWHTPVLDEEREDQNAEEQVFGRINRRLEEYQTRFMVASLDYLEGLYASQHGFPLHRPPGPPPSLPGPPPSSSRPPAP